MTQARFVVPENGHVPIAADLALRCGGAEIAVDLDLLQTGPQTWTIEIETTPGHHLVLSEGGSLLAIDGDEPRGAPSREYADVYARFTALIASGESDVDSAPLRVVGDALLVAGTDRVEAFVE